MDQGIWFSVSFERMHGCKWNSRIGKIRLMTFIQEEHLAISDPRALQHIFHKSAYNYRKPNIVRQISRQISGEGIIFSDGACTHLLRVFDSCNVEN